MHGFVNDYYDERIFTVGADSTAGQWLHLQQSLLTKTLENEIEVKSGKQWLQYFLTIFTDDEYLNLTREGLGLRRWQLVSGSDDPPTDYIQNLDSSVMTDIEKQVDLLLDIKTVSTHPSVAPAIADSSGWSYTLPAVSDSTSPIPDSTGSISGDIESDPEPAQSIVEEEAPSTMTNQTRPVAFNNTGYESATIQIDAFTPLAGSTANKPTASTVVSPEGNSSAMLELPLGEYVFCYEWDTGEDYDNDGNIDYKHAFTSAFTLSENASTNPDNAVQVSFSAPGNMIKIGKCAEQVGTYTSLTPQEQAAQGTHTVTCLFTKQDGSTSTWTRESSYQFTETGMYFVLPAEDVVTFYRRINPNEYAHLQVDTIMIFTDVGTTTSGSLNGGYTTVCTRVD